MTFEYHRASIGHLLSVYECVSICACMCFCTCKIQMDEKQLCAGIQI